MPKYELEILPKCKRCNNTTKLFAKTRNNLIGITFTTEWFRCPNCGKTQSKIVEKNTWRNNGQISKLATGDRKAI